MMARLPVDDPTFVGRFYSMERDKWFWQHADGSITLADNQTHERLPGDWPDGSKRYGFAKA